MKLVGHFIPGAQQSALRTGRTGPVFNPATGEQIGEAAFADGDLVDEAVACATAAAAEWAATPPARRAAVMFRIRAALEQGQAELAALISEENGKTLDDARGEVARGLEAVEFACGVPHLLKGEHSSNVSAGVDVYSVREPLGVVAGITPFNFPVMVPLWMIANAIACGNAFVLKPSEKDPSAPVRMAELIAAAGIPPGVLTVVQGDREAVDRLVSHPDVAAVSFVGSTPVARAVYERATAAGKRVQALGGAKNHMVVFADADVDQAASAAVAAGYGAAGERCMAVSVVVAVGGIADDLVAAIRDRASKLAVGPGTAPATQMGPLITKEHRDRVAGYLDSGVQAGAMVVLDGRNAAVSESPGFFLAPSLIDAVTPDMPCYTDEIFGPVLCVVRVSDYDEAIGLVNDNPYGNGVAVFTASGATARQFQADCKIGMVGVNVPIPVPVAQYSFGGWKSSLFGDAHMYGPDGVRFFTRQKVVTSRWDAG